VEENQVGCGRVGWKFVGGRHAWVARRVVQQMGVVEMQMVLDACGESRTRSVESGGGEGVRGSRCLR
jgi:hypothetical protein